MSVIIKDTYGRIIREGRNLRVIRDYISNGYKDDLHYPTAIGLEIHSNSKRTPHLASGTLHISFSNGAKTSILFASMQCMKRTVFNWRNLKGVEYTYFSKDAKYTTPVYQRTKRTFI